MNKLQKREKFILIWLILRPLIVALTLGLGVWVFEATTELSTLPFIWLIISGFLISFLFFIAVSMGNPLLYLQMLTDISLITGIVHFTGGIESIFSILYFIPIITASVILPFKGNLFVTTLLSIFYGVILYFEFSKIIPPVLSLGDYTPLSVFFKGYIHIISFYTVSFLSSYLAYRLRKEQEKSRVLSITTQEILKNLGEKVFVFDEYGNTLYSNDFHFPLSLNKILNNRLSEIVYNNRIYRISINSMKKLQKEAYIVVLSDITQEKKREEWLRLKEKSAFLGEITSGLAHEIRNPLMTLKGALDTMEKIDDPVKKERLLSLFYKETQHLENVVETFIRYAKLKEPNFEEIDPVPLVKSLISSFQENGISVTLQTYGEPNAIHIDPQLFILALRNLIKNAKEAVGNSDRKIDIGMRFTADSFQIECIDRGCGIPEKYIDQIFHPFFTTKENGVGMGLALVKRVVESHLGKIEVESEENKGTTFKLIFPK